MGGAASSSIGDKLKDFGKILIKGAIKAGTSSVIPVFGGMVGDYITSKFAVGVSELNPSIKIPNGVKKVNINTPQQLVKLMNQYPEEAQKAGLSHELVADEYKNATGKTLHIPGLVKPKIPELKPLPDSPKMEIKPVPNRDIESKAVGGAVYKLHPVEKLLKKKIHEEKLSMAVGGHVKKAHVKKERSPAQIAATKKLVEMMRKKRAQK